MTMAEYKTLSLRQAAKFDHDNNLKHIITGWGKISKDREKRGISRRLLRLKVKEKENV